jgi:ATP-dependent Zn protease
LSSWGNVIVVDHIVLDLKLKSVEVAQRMMPDKGIRRGYTEMVPEDWDQKNEDAARTHMTLALSGPMAERKYNWKFPEHNGADRDFKDVQSMAFTAVCKSDDLDNHGELTSDERSRILELIGSAETKAFHLVEDNYSSINRVADALQEKGTLSGEDVAAIVAKVISQKKERKKHRP